MSGFRRFVLFVFSLAGLACLAALALPTWFGLFSDEFARLSDQAWFDVLVRVCLAMTAVWLVFNLGRAIFSRRHDSISVMDIDGGDITVTRSAVASQASHVVEESGIGLAKNVEVRAGKTGPVHVTVELTPFRSVDVTRVAPGLHEALVAGLTAMCGDRLGAVDVEFLEPREGSSLADDADDAYDEDADELDEAGSGAAGDDVAHESAADATGDITIPMRGEREE